MLLTHKAIRAVADFQGQKVRTQGGAPIQVEPLKKVGVLPVSLPLGEALPAMQNQHHRRHGRGGGAVRRLQVLRYRQADDLSCRPRCLPHLSWSNRALHEVARARNSRPSSARSRARRKSLFSDWNIADIKRAEEIWKKNGGEIITLPPAEAKRYIDLVTPVATPILSANPKVKEDYEALASPPRRRIGNRAPLPRSTAISVLITRSNATRLTLPGQSRGSAEGINGMSRDYSLCWRSRP